jgi:multiple sugar transport system permease protein
MTSTAVSRRFLVACLLAVAGLFSLFPLYWLGATAFKSNAEILGADPTLFPVDPTADNFRYLFVDSQFSSYLSNSLLTVVAATAVALTLGTSAGYALSRFPLFKGHNESLSFTVLVARAIPPVAIVIPVYLTVQRVGLLDNRLGLILIYGALNVPFVIWLMRSFFEEIPRDLGDAAQVDGASALRAFWQIVLPLVAPGIAATAIFTVINIYNEFLFALVLTSTPASQTVPVGAATLIGRIQVQWGPLAAAGVIAMLPVVAFILFMQRHLVRGLTAGAVK